MNIVKEICKIALWGALAVSIFLIANIAVSKTVTLEENNHVYIDGKVSSESMDKASKELLNLHYSLAPEIAITIVLNSGGGSVLDGLRFIRIMEEVKRTRVVNTYSIWAFSMAFSIAQHGTTRYIDTFGIVGQHRAKGSFQGQFATGEVESRLKVFTEMMVMINTYEAMRCGHTLEAWQNKLVNEFWGISNTAVDTGLMDEVATLSCTKELYEAKVTKSIAIGFMQTKEVEVSACPLM